MVGRPDEMKGQAIAAFVTLERGMSPSEELRQELRQWVAKEIGALARPDDLTFTRCSAEDAQSGRSCGGCCGSWRRQAR